MSPRQPPASSSSALLTAFCVAIILAHARAQDHYDVTITIPFGSSGVPTVSVVPGLAAFKLRFKNAVQDALTSLAVAPHSQAPSIANVVPEWSFDTTSNPQTATATFPYPADWQLELLSLVASPNTLYDYSSDTTAAGQRLQSIYGAIKDVAVSIAVPASSPGVSPSAKSSPPPPVSPPPPIIHARRPPSPRPPKPALPAKNSSVDFQVSTNIYSDSVPTDDASRALFQQQFLASFAGMMDCTSDPGFNHSANQSSIQQTCFGNSTTNSTGNSTATTFPTNPAQQNWTYVEIDDPNWVNTTAANATSPPSGRRSLLAKFNTVTSAPGKVWNITVVAVYSNVTATYVTTYIAAQQTVVNGVKNDLVVALTFSDITLVQVAAYIGPGGATIPVTPETPGYTGNGGSSTGRRRLVHRVPLQVAAIIGGGNSHTTSGLMVAAQWKEAEPSDVAYGLDQAMFELFSTPLDYYAAGAACAARGSRLATYSTEVLKDGAQLFIDILCDGANGMQCWVEGNNDGSCTTVAGSSVQQIRCTQPMPFVCVRDRALKEATTTPQVGSTETMQEWVAAEPADVATDTQGFKYEIFSTPLDYYSAGSVCLARGERLVNYGKDIAQVFVDVLCDGATGQSCWVEGNRATQCTIVQTSKTLQAPCTTRKPFVCSREPAPQVVSIVDLPISAADLM